MVHESTHQRSPFIIKNKKIKTYISILTQIINLFTNIIKFSHWHSVSLDGVFLHVFTFSVGLVHYLQDPQVWKRQKKFINLGFTSTIYSLKIILLQYFQQ